MFTAYTSTNTLGLDSGKLTCTDMIQREPKSVVGLVTTLTSSNCCGVIGDSRFLLKSPIASGNCVV